MGLGVVLHLGGHEGLEVPHVVCLGLAEALHQQLGDLRLSVELGLAQSQLILSLKIIMNNNENNNNNNNNNNKI